jgi:hypothetical protein
MASSLIVRGVRSRRPPPPQLPAAASGTVVVALQPAARKKKSRLSATQKQRRREHEADQSTVYNLMLDVNDLRQQVRELEERRALHGTRLRLARQRFQDQAVSAAALFFGVFRTGFRVFEPRELAFLRTHVAPDVGFASDSRGLDAFLDQWKRYKLLFRQRVFRVSTIRVVALVDPQEALGEDSGREDELPPLDVPQGCVLECLGEFEAYLTREAMAVVFPHVVLDAPLARRLEGARIVCPTRTLVYLDGHGRIVNYDAHADFFAALNGVQSLQPADVISVMAGARIASEGSLVPAPPESLEDEISASSDCTDSSEEADAAARTSRKRHSLAYLLT